MSDVLNSAESEAAYSAEEPMEAIPRGTSEVFTNLMRFRQSPDWVPAVKQQLAGFVALRPNWDSYGAAAPSLFSLGIAQQFIDQMGQVVGVERPDLSLSPAGNASLSWELENGERNLEIEVLPDGTINFAYINEADESLDQEGSTRNVAEIANFLTQW